MTGAGLPVVAIIGRPNVGKSTLFNRVLGQRRAIVHDRPGVTRDRLHQEVSWGGVRFVLVDTGGLAPDAAQWEIGLAAAQAEKAVEEADVLLLLTDAAAGLHPLDAEIARLLRRSGKPVLLAVNKVDHPVRESLAADFAPLGLSPVHTVSAEHGLGINDLLDGVVAALPGREEPRELPPAARVAVVGRPNVGKSTLVNRFLGEERLLTHHMPGTTRDPIDTRLTRDGKDYILVDTAGIRRSGRREVVEQFSVLRANEAIRRSQICLAVMDAGEMVTDADARVAGLVKEAGRACIIVVNKWDTVVGGDRGEAERRLREALPFMDWAPVLFASAKTGRGLHRVFPLVDEVHRAFTADIPTPELNAFLYDAVKAYKPASFHGKAVSLGYMTQARTAPPSFVILTNDPARVHPSYRRYLANRFRERFALTGVPVLLRFRARPRKGKGRDETP